MQTSVGQGKIITVDADGHVLEPRDVWQRYLEPNLRERAIRIERDEDGVEALLVDGRSHPELRGRLGALGGIGMDSEDLMTIGQRRYEDGCPKGGYDPSGRLKVMDEEQIDVVLLYPTIGIAWEGMVTDPQLATAYTRAYNRWLVDFCSIDRTKSRTFARWHTIVSFARVSPVPTCWRCFEAAHLGQEADAFGGKALHRLRPERRQSRARIR
jgi:hypothetical protein